ncbi:CPSF A subunit region-domain-containing protein [Trametes punicea]|nr:CPSF A subunit region-domain-containing protein [Trametes punicea]
MRVVGTFHPSSSVSRSLKCRLTPDPALEHLVVAKTDRLEVYSLQQNGLKLECTADMWGRVVGLQAISAGARDHSNLLVMTDHPDAKIVLMSYAVDDGIATLKPGGSHSLVDRAARQAEFVTDFQVDPTGQVVVASCYAGKLKVIKLENGELGQAFDVSLPEINLLAFSFLYTAEEDHFALALLHLNHRRQMQLLCRDVLLQDLELSAAHSNLLITTVLSERTFPSLDPPPLLVPVPPHSTGSEEDDEDETGPAHRGGVLVLGGRKVMFYEHATQYQQDTRKEKQRRLSKRLSSSVQSEVAKAKEKEKERESRKIKARATVKWPWNAVTAWCAVDEHCRRILLGDAYGRLAMLAFDDDKVALTLVPLGETSSATSLTYLSSQVLYVGSHSGDSQLLRIHPAPIANAGSDTLPIPKGVSTVSPSALTSVSSKGKGRADESNLSDVSARDGRVVSTKGTFIEVLQNHDNIAPIMDAVVTDIDGSGQPQVITCSGARNTGSLRIIRTEADFQEQARLEGFSGITDIWPVRPRFEDTAHTHLVLSTLHETLVFSFAGKDTITNVDPSAAGFVTRVPTYALGNIPRRQTMTSGGRTISSYVDSSLVVQSTPEGVHLVEYDAALHTFSAVGQGWDPKKSSETGLVGKEVVAAAMSPSQFVVGLSGGRLALLNLGANDALQLVKSRDFTDEICAISCTPLDSSKNYATSIAVSFWGSNKVYILSLDSPESYLSPVCEVTLPTLPRAVLLHNFGTGVRPKDVDFHPHLLVGLADGNVVTYAFRDGELQDRKASSLGNAPASLSVCSIDGRTVVFASGARASVLYWDRQRVRPSPVGVKYMIKGVTLNSAAFPSCLAIATSSALLIGNVRGVDKMQIRAIPLGVDNPRKMAYHVAQQVFGIACTRTLPGRVGDDEDITGSFKLLDAHSFSQLHHFQCNPDEEPSSVLALPGDGSGSSPAFCLGTVVIRPEEREPSRGRLVLFSLSSVDGSRLLSVLASHDIKGCVYALAHVSHGVIAAAVNTSVMLFKIRETVPGEALPLALDKAAEWNHNHFVTNLIWDGQFLLVGDAISSVSVLRVVDDATRIESIARDYGPLWPVAIESTGNGIIGANSDCNLFSFTLQSGPQRCVLEKDGVYHIDDVVNKFIRGALSSADVADDQAVKASHVFFTSTGRIGAILEMNDAMALHMTALQRNMAKYLTGPGGVNHTKRRAPAAPRGHTDAEASYGFLDGDFLESCLTHPHPDQLMEGEIEAERITIPLATVKDALVQMQSLH